MKFKGLAPLENAISEGSSFQDSMTFVIISETIGADENEERCSRFPIVLDGDKRRVFKLRDNHDIVVYDGESNCWSTYPPSLDTPTDVSFLVSHRIKNII